MRPAPDVPGRTEAERFDDDARMMFSVSKENALKREAKLKVAYPRKASEEGIVRVFLCLFACALAFGQPPSDAPSRPNFSGTWKLNIKRSGPILPRGTEALTTVIDHRESTIRMSETRTVFGKVTNGQGDVAPIDGQEHVSNPEPGKTAKHIKRWSGNALLMHWEMTKQGTTYISDICMTLSEDGQVLSMAEHYREPGMERIRDWVFEKQ